MAETGSRRGAAPSMTPILMIVAFLAMAGFLYWLSVAAEGREAEIAVVEGEAGDTASDPSVQQVAMSTFRPDPAPYVGQRVRVTNVTVSSLLGRSGQLFWLQPDDNPYLVHRDSTMIEGRPVRQGMRGSVVGTVYEMSDSVLDAWEAAGAFTSESDRFVAEFAETYIEAERVQLRAAGQDRGGQSGGSGS